MKHHIYNQPLPDNTTPQNEFVRLVYYLELITSGVDWGCFNAAIALNWPSNMTILSPQTWCSQLAAFVNKSQIAARSFLVDQHITWHPPRLLELPREYEKIFTVSTIFRLIQTIIDCFLLSFSITTKDHVVSVIPFLKKVPFVYYAARLYV